MPKTSQWLLLLGLTGGLAAGGYAYQRGQASQQVRLAHINALADQITANNQLRAKANAAIVRRIAYSVCQNHNQRDDLAVLAQAQQIQAHTRTFLDTLTLLRQRLRNATAHPDLITQLLTQFHYYSAFIQQNTSTYYPVAQSFAVAGVYRPDALRKLPLPAALAVLTSLEAAVRRYERQALLTQAEKMSSKWDGFDKIGPLAVPTTETVTAGGTYQARLFLTQAGSRDFCNLDMAANGVPLTQPNGPGMQVQFAVPARRPGQPDTVRAHWRGTIRATLFPPDTVLQLDVPYFIVQGPAQ